MAAQDATATVTPVRMLVLFSAPLVMQRGEEIVPITLLPVQQEIEALADTCRDLGVALEIETAIATTERIGHLFATAASRSMCCTSAGTAAATSTDRACWRWRMRPAWCATWMPLSCGA